MGAKPSEELARHRQEVLALVHSAGASDVQVFGSVARGEDRPGSDVDLLITSPTTMGLFELVALEQDLEEVLGVRVDIVDSRSRGRTIDRAGAEAVPL